MGFSPEKQRRAQYWAAYIPLFFAWGVLSLALGIELKQILTLNAGHLVYTLDDPYIHLALAQNLLDGHYGVNRLEASAPCSSIVWPFLLVPFLVLGFGQLAPLLINIVCALATLWVFWHIAQTAIDLPPAPVQRAVVALFMLALIVATNTIGLVFGGMEHMLQVLLVSLVVWGLIAELERGRIAVFLSAAILVAPQLRYENLAVSLLALLVLQARGHRRTAALLGLGVLLLLGGFSFFLLQQGLEALPTSVLAKSSGGSLASINANLLQNISAERGRILFAGMLGFVGYMIFSRRSEARRLLAGAVALGLALHLALGHTGSYYRYELYIWTVALLVGLYLSGPMLSAYLAREPGWRRWAVVALLLSYGVKDTCKTYLDGLATIPIAANNIYQQQYQMHRFATQFYQKPLAVNDLGYVSYDNPNYVLDLWGLASLSALRHRQTTASPAWMNQLAERHKVELAMIYDTWFEQVPASWLKLGTLWLGSKQISVGDSQVHFYALNPEAFAAVHPLLKSFSATLPPGVDFDLLPQDNLAVETDE